MGIIFVLFSFFFLNGTDLAHLYFVESLVHLVFQRVYPRRHGRVVGLGRLVPPAQPRVILMLIACYWSLGYIRYTKCCHLSQPNDNLAKWVPGLR